MVRVTAIVPTLCESSRAQPLMRAVASLRAASLEPPLIIVVVNGNRYDDGLLRQVAKLPGVQVERIAKGSAPAAQLHGRRLVKTEFFCFLDDDDEYLPGGIDRRIEVLSAHLQCGLVVTNGVRRLRDGTEGRVLDGMSRIAGDPMAALLEQNWMTSCGALFRSSVVSAKYFEAYHDYIEWTWLAFQLAHAGIGVCSIDEETFVINESEVSASKSEAYLLSHTALIERMLNLTGRVDIRRSLSSAQAGALHQVSTYYLNQGEWRLALAFHFRSLVGRGGWRFLPYSRRFLWNRAQ